MALWPTGLALALAAAQAAAPQSDGVHLPWEPVAAEACAALTPWQAFWTSPSAQRLAWVQGLGLMPTAEQTTWLTSLAWDDDLEVRMAAQAAAGGPCARGHTQACAIWLQAFGEARGAPGRWRARVALLHCPGVPPQPEALAQDPLTLVARLSALLTGPAAAPARAALRALAEDEAPEVQEAAAAALLASGE